MAARACAKHAAWDSRVQICIENCIPEMPLSRQLVQIIGRNKFHQIRKFVLDFKGQSADSNESKSGQIKLQRLFFRKRDSYVKGTRLSVLILAKSQAGRKFEVLEAACLVSIYTFIE